MDTIYLIYDNECILCTQCAKALKIKNAVGHLEVISARIDHPLVTEALELGYDLNEGIVVKYKDSYYHGQEAVSFLALLSNPVDLFNKLNARLFKHKWAVIVIYPLFKAIRNCLLFLRRTPGIKQHSEQPLFRRVFRAQWDSMPVIFHKRYANRSYHTESVILNGTMNIYLSKYYKLISPFLRFSGALVPFAGTNIPVTITLSSTEDSESVMMDRVFHYPEGKPYHFKSKIIVTSKLDVLEIMKYGLGIRLAYKYQHQNIHLNYKGYIWRFMGLNIPIPMAVFLGRVTALETVLSDDAKDFKMIATANHLLYGKIFEYSGQFKVTKEILIK
tara:strand:+ start:44746 stop:45738 length:993 start_codon:yes stop_codon:yes gene_type:complete